MNLEDTNQDQISPAGVALPAIPDNQTPPVVLTGIQLGAIASSPTNWQKRYRNALMGLGSPRQAIATKCSECCGFEDVVNRVGGCTVQRCPLWHFRPFQNKETPELETDE